MTDSPTQIIQTAQIQGPGARPDGPLPPGQRRLTLLLVRHGETEWNAQHRWQGHCDIPLSAIGREQAALLGKRLGRLWRPEIARALPANARVPVATRILCSDLCRAHETAQIIADASGIGRLPIDADGRLRERSFGCWEGLTDAEVRERFGPEVDRPHDAESYDDVWARMGAALEGLWLDFERADDSDAVILAVGHGGSLRAWLAHAVGLGSMGVRRFVLANTSLSVVSFTGPTLSQSIGRLWRFNDVAHLEESLS